MDLLHSQQFVSSTSTSCVPSFQKQRDQFVSSSVRLLLINALVTFAGYDVVLGKQKLVNTFGGLWDRPKGGLGSSR